MKQKYTLTIADSEFNVISEESPETVDMIVGIIDRKIREISLKSRNCSKSEAAVLCALDYCAEKIKLQNTVNELSKKNDALKTQTEHLSAAFDAQSEELENLRHENALMKNILQSAASRKTEAPSSAPVKEAEAPAKDEEAAPKKPGAKKKTAAPKNKVGDMFDTLSFGDI